MLDRVDPQFRGLPLGALADAALDRARVRGAQHADLRVERIVTQTISLRDGSVTGVADETVVGLAVRVLVDGVWGFASHGDLTPERAAATAEQAVQVARTLAPVARERVERADEPVHADAVWVSAYALDPFDVPTRDKVALLTEWSRRLLASDGVDHVQTGVAQVRECKFYADLAGTSTIQQRVRVAPSLTATSVDRASGRLRDDGHARGARRARLGVPHRRRLGLRGRARHDPRAARGEGQGARRRSRGRTTWSSTPPTSGSRSTSRSATLPSTTARSATRPPTRAPASPRPTSSAPCGTALTSCTSPATARSRTAWPPSASTTTASPPPQWDLVRDGVLVGYQLDRAFAPRLGLARSNGCAFADSPHHVPIQRMANVSLQPDPARDTSTDELIAGVERGIYVVGDKSWSIDMQRYNFQFTGQRFYRIENGALAGQLRDVAYQATTTDFWGSLDGVGGPSTWVLGGAMNCGKAQPGQVAAVSHGCPSARFRGVNVLNTREEGR